MLKVYGASYFFEEDPNIPIVVLWTTRDNEDSVQEVRIPYIYLGNSQTTWTKLFDDMKRPFVDRQDWQYGSEYYDKDPFFHMESLEPLEIPEPQDYRNSE